MAFDREDRIIGDEGAQRHVGGNARRLHARNIFYRIDDLPDKSCALAKLRIFGRGRNYVHGQQTFRAEAHLRCLQPLETLD